MDKQPEVIETLQRLRHDMDGMRQNMEASLTRVDALLTKLGDKGTPNARYFALLGAVHKAPNGLPKAEFHRIAKRVGYDPRGAAGFFKGKNASLTYLPSHDGGEDRVFITKRGKQYWEEAQS